MEISRVPRYYRDPHRRRQRRVSTNIRESRHLGEMRGGGAGAREETKGDDVHVHPCRVKHGRMHVDWEWLAALVIRGLFGPIMQPSVVACTCEGRYSMRNGRRPQADCPVQERCARPTGDQQQARRNGRGVNGTCNDECERAKSPRPSPCRLPGCTTRVDGENPNKKERKPSAWLSPHDLAEPCEKAALVGHLFARYDDPKQAQSTLKSERGDLGQALNYAAFSIGISSEVWCHPYSSCVLSRSPRAAGGPAQSAASRPLI
jgi:hypothetical protein